MLWVFIGLLGGFAFVFLTKLYWSDASNRPDPKQAPRRGPLVTTALAVFAFALLMMITSGKLHWLSGAVTAVVPFLRRLTSLIRYAPLIANLFGKAPERPTPSTPATSTALTLAQARAMLEVSESASRAEIVAAHRRLMAKNHPDHGGSNYIAAQLNSARELLLGVADE